MTNGHKAKDMLEAMKSNDIYEQTETGTRTGFVLKKKYQPIIHLSDPQTRFNERLALVDRYYKVFETLFPKGL